MADVTILVVEDNPLTRKLVRAALAREPWTVVEAATGAEARAALAERRVDVVLQDMILPDCDGFDLVRELRALPNASGAPILAFSGLLSSEEQARASAAGFDGFVAKPVEPSQLRYVIRGHLPAPPSARRAFGDGKRLVLADDDALQLKLGRYRLARLGFDVEAVSDGEEVIAAARRARPDAIVTDALMPRLDGFGVCVAVRQDPALADVPIVLVTSSYVEDADKELARRAGANAFVVRTAELGGVIAALEGIFAGERAELPRASVTKNEVDLVRSQRVVQQLERQVALNAGLVQRCSTLSAELSVLTTIAEALVDMRDVEGALRDILASCLDVAGASRGAIFACEPEGRPLLKVHHGFGEEIAALRAAVASPALLARAESSDDPFEAPSGWRRGSLVVPMRVRARLVGLLVLEAPR
ncbi:MAG TPA: response regulator, partial [Minicystis sp.]|nr:response regulator [Minicystis sp.]